MDKTFKIKEKIKPQALMILIFIGLSECILIHLTNSIIGIAGRDAWIVVVLGSILSIPIVYLLVTLAHRFSNENFLQYSNKVWGKPITYIIAAGYFFYWLLYIALFLDDTIQINKMYFLQKTPVSVQIIFLLIAFIWLISYGFSNVIRLFQVMFPFLILTLLPGIGFSMQKVDFSSFFPILENGFWPIIKGMIIYLGFLQGIEVILFTHPFFYNGSKKAVLKNVFAGMGLINFLAFSQIVISVGGLGMHCANKTLWANFLVLELIEVPGLVGQRFDLLFTFAWLISLFCAGALFYYLASYGLIQIFNLKKKSIAIFSVGILVIMLSYIIPNYSWNIFIWQILNYITIVFIFFIPLLTLVLAVLRKQGRSIT